MATEEMLVFGYCREIEEILDDQIVPNGISQLCLMYYLSSNLMFFISYSENYTSRHLEIFNIDTKKTFNCDIKLLSNTTSNTHYNESVSLPLQIEQKYFGKYYNKQYAALFLSFNTVPHALIFDPIQLQGTDTDDTVKVFDWILPKNMNNAYTGTYELYSSINGLMKIGGYDNHNDKNEFCRIVFDKDLDAMKWQTMPDMKIPRYKSSAVILNRGYKEKVFVVGGYYYDNGNGTYPKTVETFDFEENKWKILKDVNNPSEEMGIYYHEQYDKRIYIGGGVDYKFGVSYSKMVRYYDIHKDEWIELGNTNDKHINYPVLWMENQNILYIASNNSVTECIDLRESTNTWTEVDNHFANKLVSIITK